MIFIFWCSISPKFIKFWIDYVLLLTVHLWAGGTFMTTDLSSFGGISLMKVALFVLQGYQVANLIWWNKCQNCQKSLNWLKPLLRSAKLQVTFSLTVYTFAMKSEAFLALVWPSVYCVLCYDRHSTTNNKHLAKLWQKSASDFIAKV